MDITAFKQSLLREIYAPYTNLKKCPVDTHACTQLVFGEGNPNAQIMLIGEAPGQDEDRLGRPFVGRSGKLLTECLNALGLKREDVFITNIVKCRPPENRKPLPNEVAFFRPLLLREIKIIRPKVLCTLGASALESLVQQPLSITKARGKPLPLPEKTLENIIVVPTLHPAYVLRNMSAKNDLMHDLAEALRISKGG